MIVPRSPADRFERVLDLARRHDALYAALIVCIRQDRITFPTNIFDVSMRQRIGTNILLRRLRLKNDPADRAGDMSSSDALLR